MTVSGEPGSVAPRSCSHVEDQTRRRGKKVEQPLMNGGAFDALIGLGKSLPASPS